MYTHGYVCVCVCVSARARVYACAHDLLQYACLRLSVKGQ
jgi:hypothetical protein